MGSEMCIRDSASVESLLPASAWAVLSPQLFATFWCLGLPDILLPTAAYETAAMRIRAAQAALDNDADRAVAAVTRRRKERERYAQLAERLKADAAAQADRVRAVRDNLRAHRDLWFPPSAAAGSERASMCALLQYCIFPRATLSPADARFCSELWTLLHAHGTPRFSTLQFIDRLLKDLAAHVFACTEREAANLGRFVADALGTLHRWKASRAVYDRECRALPGFSVSLKQLTKRASYEEFASVTAKWYAKMAKQLTAALESKEYMEVCACGALV